MLLLKRIDFFEILKIFLFLSCISMSISMSVPCEDDCELKSYPSGF